MSDMFGDVQQLLADRVAIELDPSWSIGGALTAGYLQSLSAEAGLRTSQHPHPIATTTDFLQPASPGPATFSVELLKSGKTLDRLRVTMIQDDEPVLITSLVTSVIDESPSDVDMSRPIELPPPDRCTRIESTTLRDRHLGVLDHVDLRLAPECISVLRGGADGSFTIRGWVNMADGRDFDTPTLIRILDAFPPATYTIGRFGWAPTIQRTTYLRNLPTQGWLRAERCGRVLAGDVLDEECIMRDSAGVVIAQTHQLIKMPRKMK
ncbi:MAG: thioesterase family protein [Corynebacteriales bacterium]|nr:thioesterase family protein [Mycobacteriales bacterium]